MKFVLLFSCVTLCSVSTNSLRRQARVFGGDDVLIGQYPYVVFIVIGRTSVMYCTGSIISKSWVLTAAHCVESQLVPTHKIRIYAGIVNYYAQPLPKSAQILYAKNAITHPAYTTFNATNYTDIGSFNDLGLIQTMEPFILNKFVNIVSIKSVLPHFEQVNMCKAMGFGRTEEGGTKKLKSISLTSLFRCTEVADDELNTLFQSQDYLCSSAGVGRYVYNGDSGSPMVCNGILVAVCFWVKYVSEKLDRVMLHIGSANFVDWITYYVPDVTVCANKGCEKRTILDGQSRQNVFRFVKSLSQ
ncbi:trypsin-10-like [Periplaneta americana]|uniref:trypsin-10-like n=1 Tax=Periplaneta americana TaxID=6978 RepID=UPI0037E77931